MTTVSLKQVSKVFPGTDGSPFPVLEETSLEVPSEIGRASCRERV